MYLFYSVNCFRNLSFPPFIILGPWTLLTGYIIFLSPLLPLQGVYFSSSKTVEYFGFNSFNTTVLFVPRGKDHTIWNV
jgi:hypothetical protein